jgi:hypothetical protein
MLHAGLDLSRNRIDVCLLSEHGEVVAEFATPSDADGLAGLARRVLERGEPVRGVIESMTGARFVHDTLEQFGWDVLHKTSNESALSSSARSCFRPNASARVPIGRVPPRCELRERGLLTPPPPRASG